MPQVINNLDLKKNEIQNVVLQPLSTPPSDPKIGQKYFNTNDKNEYRWNGTAWVTYQAPLSTTTASTISIDSTPTASSTNLVTSGGVYSAIQSSASDTFIISFMVDPFGNVTCDKTDAEISEAVNSNKTCLAKISTYQGKSGLGVFNRLSITEDELVSANAIVSINDGYVYSLTWPLHGSAWEIEKLGEDYLPDQTSNNGKFLTTNGTASSWSDLPTASSGTAGVIKVGTNLSISNGVLSATDTTYTFDGTYNASTNKAATQSTVTNAINALDGSITGTAGAGKTFTAFSQTNGKVTATFGDISITKSQISDFPTIPSPADANPLMDGTAAVGSSTDYAREDHVHPSDTSKISTSAIGAASGVAPLNASRQIDPSYLPSYVDDVIEGYYNSTDGKFYEEDTYITEITPEAGKIYINLSTNKSYRWGGSTYVEMPTGSTVTVSPTLTSGEEVGTITIDGTTTTLYAPEDTDTKVNQTKVTYSSYTYWRAIPFGTYNASTPIAALSATNSTDREYTVDNLRFWPQNGWIRTHAFNPTPNAAGTTNSYNQMTSDSVHNIYFRVNATGTGDAAGDTVMTLYSDGTDMQVRPGGQYDNKVDLGKSTVRWKNLYVGTNAYIDGTIYNNPSSTTVASGDKILINDTSAGTISSGITLGSSTTQYLANDGSWQNIPAGLPAITASDNGKVLTVNGTSASWETAQGGGSIATTTSVLKGDNSGGAIAATVGTDYLGPSSLVTWTDSTPTPTPGSDYRSVYLPPVTSADNGKILAVVNGEWTAVELPLATGVDF